MINWEFFIIFFMLFATGFVIAFNYKKQLEEYFKELVKSNNDQLEKSFGVRKKITKQLRRKHTIIFTVVFFIIFFLTSGTELELRILILGPVGLVVLMSLYSYFFHNLPEK